VRRVLKDLSAANIKVPQVLILTDNYDLSLPAATPWLMWAVG
jgi:hypothetical protein